MAIPKTPKPLVSSVCRRCSGVDGTAVAAAGTGVPAGSRSRLRHCRGCGHGLSLWRRSMLSARPLAFQWARARSLERRLALIQSSRLAQAWVSGVDAGSDVGVAVGSGPTRT